jgi:eukaryotic-like serine/threonine-protein kinase
VANVEREQRFPSAEETFERDRIDASVRANDGPAERDVPSVPPSESSDPRRSSSPFYGNTLVGVPPPPARAATPRSLAIGGVYAGDFRIVRAIARGGMGAVFEVDQLSTGRRRALKVIRVPGALDVATRDRFLREARASAMIDSPHVVEVVVAGSDDATSTLWIAMEFLAGETLADRLGRLQPGVALAQRETWVVLSELLRGLSKAHARGVVHRDLKPTNVFLARSGDEGQTTVKILDFGIACFHDTQENKLTDPIGTPLWMAPEQARPSRITPSVDVWAVGLLAFRLFAGRSYWLAARDPSPNVRDVLAELLYEPLETASDRAEALGCVRRLPMGFDGWFARCVARDSADRFADATEAAAALARIAPPDLALDASPSRRPRPAMHPVARPEAAPSKPTLGAPPRRPLNGAANLPQRAPRTRHDSLHPRLEDDLHEAATARMSTVSADEAIARVPAPPMNPAALPRARAPTELLIAMPAATPPTPPPPVSQGPLRFRVALLVAVLVGGVAAILQAPGVLRPRPAHTTASHTPATGDARTGPWAVGEGRVWRGEASGADARFAYTAVLRLTRPDRVSGFISWTVERSPMAAAGEQVRENVDGAYDPTLGSLELHGTLSTNSLVYPVNAYRLRVRADGSFDGQSLDAALVLHGVAAN